MRWDNHAEKPKTPDSADQEPISCADTDFQAHHRPHVRYNFPPITYQVKVLHSHGDANSPSSSTWQSKIAARLQSGLWSHPRTRMY